MRFKYSVGDIIENDKSKFKILDIVKGDSKTKAKYQYKCLACGYIGFKTSAKLVSRGCPCCSNKIIQKGINDIATTNPEMIKYFKNKEDAYNYGKGSHEKISFVCPDCGYEKYMRIEELFIYGFACPKCSDGIPYTEKVMRNVLEQLNVKFITQLSKKHFKWCDKYKYDFYLTDYNTIIETHGEQHYTKSFNCTGAKTLSEQKEIDGIKKELALLNNIDNYIVIDCRKSDLEYIKSNILSSDLNNMLKLIDVDWNKCEENVSSSLVKQVCDYWNDVKCIKDTCKKFNLTKGTIQKYLKIGARLSLCGYDPLKSNQIKPKPIVKIICLNDENVFDSIVEASKHYKVSASSISISCIRGRGVKYDKAYQDLYFMYYDEYIKLSQKELENIKTELEYKKYGHRIICVETGEKFNTYTECGNKFNLTDTSIKKICDGKVKKSKCGYTFKYIKDTI